MEYWYRYLIWAIPWLTLVGVIILVWLSKQPFLIGFVTVIAGIGLIFFTVGFFHINEMYWSF